MDEPYTGNASALYGDNGTVRSTIASLREMSRMQCEDQPWYPEDTLFEEEWLRTRGEFTGYERIAVSFAFMSEGEIVPIGPQAGGKEYQGLELLAAVGNSKGRRGMFAQAVWFGDGGAPWKWMRIDGIEKVILYDGLAHPFRSGLEPCVGVRTARGHYFLTIPHPDYQDAWRRTLENRWPKAEVEVKVWPLEGCRPPWWPCDYKDDWPFDKSDPGPLSKELEKQIMLNLQLWGIRKRHL
ncbi:hypothetical protein V565_086560 [Rhizoctonia solani 123E]|uniref:Uncharacterized protein n=1 Tax=Rhizoctonia solani 123E TaxID=1423351 RepID=A0A074RT96_9AGAM|nr:hypothetical protein V565_086560 [Rhizoctonia solani 123E]